MSEALDVRLRKTGVCVFLAAEVSVAADIAAVCNEAATELQRVWPLLKDATRLLAEIQKRQVADDMPGQIHGMLDRIKQSENGTDNP